MRRRHFNILVFIGLIGLMSSCSISNHSMKSPNYHIEFYKGDFEYSPQVTAEATSIRVFGIDWQRLFNWETGEISSDRFDSRGNNFTVTGNILADPIVGAIGTVIPVIGDYGKGKVSSYALYNLMRENPGYDLVIYPQFETKKFIFPLIYSKRTVKVTARLGKIK